MRWKKKLKYIYSIGPSSLEHETFLGYDAQFHWYSKLILVCVVGPLLYIIVEKASVNARPGLMLTQRGEKPISYANSLYAHKCRAGKRMQQTRIADGDKNSEMEETNFTAGIFSSKLLGYNPVRLIPVQVRTSAEGKQHIPSHHVGAPYVVTETFLWTLVKKERAVLV